MTMVLSSIALYVLFAYNLERSDFVKLLSLYSGLFILFWLIMRRAAFSEKGLFTTALLFRIAFLFSIPNLSQDFYRFIWDGRMILEGLNPYLQTPFSFLDQGSIPVVQGAQLIDGMGSLSAGNLTNYPPLNQLCFMLAGLFAGKSILGSVIVLRIIVILADLGTILFGKKLLQKLNLDGRSIYLYALNPFIIIELTGNLHFEGVMVFFLVWSLYLLAKGKWIWSALVLSLSVSVKLIPLMFLPLLIQRLGYLKSASYYALVGAATVLSFLPFYNSQFFTNYAETIALWFQKFEFNASIYYIAREIGYGFRGFNEIAIIGSNIPVLVVAFIGILAIIRNNLSLRKLLSAILLALSFYLFTSTTVHPWYIVTLLAISVYTNYRFPLVWSYVIVLSYYAYREESFQENLLVIVLEYAVVYGLFFYEVIRSFRQPDLLHHEQA